MNKKIIETAEALKEKYNTCDPVELCRCLGITFLRADLPKKLLGFYMESRDRQAACVSTSLEAPLDRAVAAHELGHALLHRGLNLIFLCDSTNFVHGRYEREADLFSAALLVDKENVKRSENSILAVSKRTGIPVYAIEQLLKGE